MDVMELRNVIADAMLGLGAASAVMGMLLVGAVLMLEYFERHRGHHQRIRHTHKRR